MALCHFLRGTFLRTSGKPLTASVINTLKFSSVSGVKLAGNLNGAISKKEMSTILQTIAKHPASFMGTRSISLSPARHSEDHSKLWAAERVLAITLIGTVPLCLLFPCPVFDTAAAITIVLHQYWGLEAVVTDYIRPILFGELAPVVAQGLLVVITLATLGGLFYFIYNDIGLGMAVRRIWNLGKVPNHDSKKS